MKKHSAIALLLALALFLSLSPAIAQEDNSGVSNLKAVVVSSFQVKVTWDSPDSAFKVFYQPVKGDVYYYVDAYAPSAMLYVSPSTDYQIWVQAEGGEASKLVYASTPKASSQREYGYKYRTLTFYTTTGSSNENFFDDGTRVRVDRVQGALLAGAGEVRNYYLVDDFYMTRTKQDKELHYMLVLTPPNSPERLIDHGDLVLPGNWMYINYAFNLNGLLQTHLNHIGEMSPGRYAIDLIINGWHAGGTVLIVE